MRDNTILLGKADLIIIDNILRFGGVATELNQLLTGVLPLAYTIFLYGSLL